MAVLSTQGREHFDHLVQSEKMPEEKKQSRKKDTVTLSQAETFFNQIPKCSYLNHLIFEV